MRPGGDLCHSRAVTRAAALAALAAAAVQAAAGHAHADEPIDGEAAGERAPVENRINLRIGRASTDLNGRPTICMDVRVIGGFGIESCGTGQALLHNDAAQEMSHYRVNYAFASRPLWKGTLNARGGIGFAELQVGVDHPGFKFGDPDADRGSVAGPETALSAQWLLPMYKGLDFVVTATGGVAYFAGADQLITTKSNMQAFASFEAGIGW